MSEKKEIQVTTLKLYKKPRLSDTQEIEVWYYVSVNGEIPYAGKDQSEAQKAYDSILAYVEKNGSYPSEEVIKTSIIRPKD